MVHPTQTSCIERLVRAAGYSADGLRAAYSGERAFRLEVWLAVPMLPSAVWLGRGWVEVAMLAGTVLLVMIVELVNSAVEAVVDRVSLDRHTLSKRAKDMGSAAVLLALLLCGSVWAAALWQRFIS